MGASTPAVILLGAATYPGSPEFSHQAFGQAHDNFRDYCRGALGIPDHHLLDLFDSTADPSAVVTRIQGFLSAPETEDCTVIVVHYVGHGDRVGKEGKYALALAATRHASLDSSSLHLAHLDEATKEAGRTRPIVLILDACFAAAAAEAFTWPKGSAGLSIFASASSAETSQVAEGADATSFTTVLLEVLARGTRRCPRALSLRDLKSLIRAEVPEDGAQPEVHSPRQTKGDIADLPLFPNPAYSVRVAVTDGTGLPWCAVTAEADVDHTFTRTVERFGGNLWRINRDVGRPLASSPTFIDAGDVFASADSFQDAVTTVSSAALAFFDLTRLEPAVLVLLGIRAVIRRGVTICSVAQDSDEVFVAPPFLLRDINFVNHGPDGDSVEAFSRRAYSGMTEMQRTPHRYTDLPGFETIRQLPPGHQARPQFPYSERVLVLCSFEKDYNAKSWPEIRAALRATIGRSAKSEVRVERTLEISSTRLVSANLMEAIRFTDFCLCDLTGWRPNVLFELGLRLAANPIEPVCMIDRETPSPARVSHVAQQRADLISLLDVLEYTPREDGDFDRVVEQHLANVKRERRRRLDQDSGVYAEVWQHAEAAGEATTTDVVTLLERIANDRAPDRQTGSSPLIFPAKHTLVDAARRSSVEALIAAWFYLQHRSDESAHRTESMTRVGNQLVPLLEENEDNADQQLAAAISEELDRLEGLDHGD